MLDIAICDDDDTIVIEMENLIIDICKRENILINIDVFYSGGTLEKSILLGDKYDILFLDIQMQGNNGIITASNLRKVDDNVIIIFVSSYDQYLMELFRLDVFTFIKKPFEEEVFIKVFLEAVSKVGNKNFYFTFQYQKHEYKIPCKDILYFESNGRKINIIMKNGDIERFNGKLSEVEMKLLEGKIPFLRIHQSYLVNFNLIKSRSKSQVTLINKVKLPISEGRQSEFGRKYSKLLGDEVNV